MELSICSPGSGVKDSYTKFVDLCDAKIEKMCQRKQSHRIIFTWFGNFSTAMISLFKEKYKMRQYNFFFSQNNTPNPNLINNDIYILHCGFKMGQAFAP